MPLDYDPLLSKLITWGKTREETILRMRRALSEYQIYGIKTTIPFFQRILLHPLFLAGQYTTHFIADLEKEPERENPAEEIVALIAAGIKSGRDVQVGAASSGRRQAKNWKIQGLLEAFAKRL